MSGRLQYIDPGNDQAYSPYLVYAPRFDFDPFFRERFDTRFRSPSRDGLPEFCAQFSDALAAILALQDLFHAFGAIETTRTWLLMAVRLSPTVTRDS